MNKRLMAASVAAANVLGMIAPFADTLTINDKEITLSASGDSEMDVDYQKTSDDDFSNTTNVYAVIGEDFEVVIPKTIVLSGKEKKASYTVTVSGDIAGESKVTVSPDDTFKLSAANKDDVTATVDQQDQEWDVDAVAETKSVDGTITANDLTAGKWSGNFDFTIGFESGIAAPHVHDYIEEITLQATCTEDGLATFICECGDSYTEDIAAGHKFTRTSWNGSEYDIPQCEICKTLNPNYDFNIYTVSWSKPLATNGSYLGVGDLSDTTTTQYGSKRIKYINENGEVAYANPYVAGSIKVLGVDLWELDALSLEMYAGGGTSFSKYTPSYYEAGDYYDGYYTYYDNYIKISHPTDYSDDSMPTEYGERGELITISTFSDCYYSDKKITLTGYDYTSQINGYTYYNWTVRTNGQGI